MTRRATAQKETPAAAQPDAEVGASSLTAQQEAALVALLECSTLAAAVERSGVSRSTLWRYMQDETFAQRLREARREVVSHVVLRLHQAAEDAVIALHDIVKDAEAADVRGAAVRVSAARVILDVTFKADELEEVKAKIAELEKYALKKQEDDALDRAKEKEGEE